jgi:hypothetical protein
MKPDSKTAFVGFLSFLSQMLNNLKLSKSNATPLISGAHAGETMLMLSSEEHKSNQQENIKVCQGTAEES